MTDTFPILLTGENLPTLHQEREALADKLADAGRVVTEIVQAGDYWQAEDYHQQYVEKSRQGRFSVR